MRCACDCILPVLQSFKVAKCLAMTGFEPALYPTGLEPAMFRSEVWCIIHYATSCSTSWATWPVREWSRRKLLAPLKVVPLLRRKLLPPPVLQLVLKFSKLVLLSYFTLIKSQPWCRRLSFSCKEGRQRYKKTHDCKRNFPTYQFCQLSCLVNITKIPQFWDPIVKTVR